MGKNRRKRPENRRRSKQKGPNLIWVLGLGLALLVAFGVWLANAAKPTAQLVSEYGFPPYLANASTLVQTTYARAVDHQDDLEYIACYCGCGPGNGHRSLRDCFIQDAQPGGSILYSSHAAT